MRAADLDDLSALAGWSRELSANAWQGRAPDGSLTGAGAREDRNACYVVAPPFELRAAL